MKMIGRGTTGTTHDFYAFNQDGEVWDGEAFVAWNDADYASYRVEATEQGTSGFFTGTEPEGTHYYELRERGVSLSESPVVWTETVTPMLARVPRAGQSYRYSKTDDSNPRDVKISEVP